MIHIEQSTTNLILSTVLNGDIDKLIFIKIKSS